MSSNGGEKEKICISFGGLEINALLCKRIVNNRRSMIQIDVKKEDFLKRLAESKKRKRESLEEVRKALVVEYEKTTGLSADNVFVM